MIPRSEAHRKFYSHQPLSSSGPYLDYTTRVSSLIPKVATADLQSRFIPLLKNRHTSVTLLNLKENAPPHCEEFTDLNDLQKHFYGRMQAAKPDTRCVPERRIYILEGLNAHYIAVVGGFFWMDPAFFADQEQTQVWAKSQFGTRMTERLPSLAGPETLFCLPYFEMMYFEEPIKNFEIKCRASGRHVGVTRLRGEFQAEVIVRRKCSFWSRKNDDGGWDVVILTDPPVKEVVQHGHPIMMPNAAPFQGGYLDFIPGTPPPMDVPSGPPRTSMRDDILYYWHTHYALLSSLSSPQATTLFPLKIIASQYMLLLHSIRSIVSSQEWHLSRRNNLSDMPVDYVEEQWSDLQALNRRCGEYCEDVERIMVALGIKAEYPDLSHTTDWMSSAKDFQFIYARLKALKARYEVLLGSITGLAGIAGNRQSLAEAKRSFREAKNIKILTLIGMVFIPLAFICGLFSMNDKFLPGSTEFWIYWAAAIPLIVVVIVGSMIANLGYDDDAGTWSFANIWRAAKRISWSKGDRG